MSKILIAFYSRTGTTRKLAEKLKKELNCDIDEIIDKKERSGPINYLIAGKDAMQKNLTEISFKKDPEKYSLILVGTPIWSWTITPAIRTYLEKNKNKIKKLAFFCTMGGSGNDRAFKSMGAIIKPLSTLALTAKEVIENSQEAKIKDFCRRLIKGNKRNREVSFK